MRVVNPVLVTLALLVTGLAPAAADPSTPSSGAVAAADAAKLNGGTTLRVGQSLRSGSFRLVMQGDGNLVGYGPAGAGWSSRTRGAGNRAVMQTDGNFVVYSAANRPLWSTRTAGNGSSTLRLRTDGKLVLSRADGRATWDRRLSYVSSTRTLTAAEQNAMRGVSWRQGCPVPLSRLRRVTVTYFDFSGQPREGALVVRSDVAPDVATIFGRLYAARFPIQQIRPIEAFRGNDDASMAANNTSAFNCRAMVGSSKFSKHAYGSAIDINPVQNPYVKGYLVLPPAGRAYRSRTHSHPAVLKPGSRAVREFEARGWKWGGRWNSLKDYQHFEK